MFFKLLLIGLGLQVAGLPLSAQISSSSSATVAREALQTLKTECFSCHNPEKKKGGLSLSTAEGLARGSENGAVLQAGQPGESKLFTSLRPEADPHMPPKKQLAQAQISLLEQWIQQGATWNAAGLTNALRPVAVVLQPLPAAYRPVMASALSPDASQIAFGSGGVLSVFGVSTNYPAITNVAAHTDVIQALGWSSQGEWLASGGFQKVSVWHGKTFAPEKSWTTNLLGLVSCLKFNPHTGHLVVADSRAAEQGWVRILSLTNGQEMAAWAAHGDAIYGMDISRDGKRLVTAGADKLIKVWDLESLKEIASLEGHGSQVWSVAFNTNATQVVSAGADHQLYLWDVAAREKIGSLGKHTEPITSVSWPGEGKTIFATTAGGRLLSYQKLKSHTGEESASSGEERQLGKPGESLVCLEVNAMGQLIFAGSQEGSLQVLNGEGKALARLKATDPLQAGSVASAPAREAVANSGHVSFVRDVLPALSRAGCNAGACHAKAEGQNGFKLSVFSYDPKADYDEIVKEGRARRLFPAAPEESLILRKPTTALAHEGGLRFETHSETYQLLVRWIRSGMPYELPGEPALVRVRVTPATRSYTKKATQQLLVTAQYADGSERDVTRLAAFAANDKEIVQVDELGRMSVGSLTGQGVVVARYMGLVADSQIMVPAEKVLPAARYAALPQNNYIDGLAYNHFQKLGLFPSELCSDTVFLRRAKLDALGVLPTAAEVRSFLADPSPQKRRQAIEAMLKEPAYADYWANKWADLLRPNPDRVGIKSVYILDQWLRESFRQNKPYDQFVKEILLAEGTNHRDGPAVIYRDRREPQDLTTLFSQVFTGVRLECAKCHHHPNEKWAQDDFYQFAAFFATVKQKGAGVSPPISAGTETFYFSPGATVKHPVTGAEMAPRVLEGAALTNAENSDPRTQLVSWLTSPDNPYFARAAVNRVWAVFFGRGLVDPVDDFRASNPCVNPELLEALSRDFAKNGYDLKKLMATILESRLYQLSSVPNEYNLADTRHFSRAYRRRLAAEVMQDAISDVTGVPDTFAAMPIGSRAIQTWSYKIESHLMDAFGRPNSSSDCPCERDTQMSLVQSLHLMNAKGIQSKLAHPSSRVRQLVESKQSPEEIVTEIYLSTLGRLPAAEELKIAAGRFSAPEITRQIATEDVFWALLNSAEFVFNH